MSLLRLLKISFAFLLTIGLLSGCSPQQNLASQDPLVICVEEMDVPFYSQLLRNFKNQHPEANFTFQAIPSAGLYEDENFSNDPEKKAIYDQLRTEIMSGGGPDLFLLPSTNSGLFPDLEKNMRSGVFLDLKPLLENFLEELNLQSAVMEAGKVGDARYIVPLSFAMPVLITTPDLFGGCSVSLQDSPVMFLEKLQEHFNLNALRNFDSVNFYLASLSASPFLDYEEQSVRTDADIIKLAEYGIDAMLNRDLDYSDFPSLACPVRLGMEGTPDGSNPEFWIAEMWEKGYTPLLLPFPNGERGTTATVSFFAAVRGNSKQALLASQIIQFLLLPESQLARRELQGINLRHLLPVNLDVMKDVYSYNLTKSSGSLTEGQERDIAPFAEQFAVYAKSVNRAVIGRKANEFFQKYLVNPVAYRGVSMEDAVAELETAMRFYFEE